MILLKQMIPVIVSIFCVTVVAGQHKHSAASGGADVFMKMMDTMMVKMEAVTKQSDAALSFLNYMIPHHEGAVSMAAYEIQHGQNFSMRQLAKSILTEQQMEVRQMKIWLQTTVYDTILAGNDFQKSIDLSMKVMMQNLPNGRLSNSIDEAFARVMIPHHQAAIDMARALIQNGTGGTARSFANRLIASQSIEVEQMLQYLNKQL